MVVCVQNMLTCVLVCDPVGATVAVCDCVSVLCPHRFGVIVQEPRCAPAQQEASGGIYALTQTANSPTEFLPTRPPPLSWALEWAP